MKIGLDLDGTITAAPEFFRIVAEALLQAGHEVHVITWRRPEFLKRTQRTLDELGMRYSALHVPEIADTLKPVELWKARVVVELGIELMIDDSADVLGNLPTTVKRMWMCGQPGERFHAPRER
ncbi:MAG: HAD family hydrolase [Planctomycetota bacterium]